MEILVDLIREAHDPPAAGHPSRHRTLALLKRHYYWPNIKDTVKRYIEYYYLY